MQIFHLYNRLLFIHVTSAVRTTAWLTVLDGTQPTVFDNDIDTSLRVETDYRCFVSPISIPVHLMIACEHLHCKRRKMFIMLLNLPVAKILSSKTPRFDGFFVIKLATQMDSKNPYLGGKKQQWEP